jgi:hypothetical protein
VENESNPHLRNGRRDTADRIRDIGDIGKLGQDIEDEFPIWRIWHEKNIPLRELQEEWTYDEIMRASAVLDMYSAVDIAREAYDKAEMERKQREIESKAGRH